ncbi:MAG TPA: YfhO family protein, partial [Bacteroidales bacterium]|nr:YfhO family protein [Bacteroidales bacterium]
ILEDQSGQFRVWNLTEDFDKSARTSFFHKNIGGYHAAKLRRFQELYDYRIAKEREQLVEVFSAQPDFTSLNTALNKMKAINMLNTRYIIYNPDSEPLVNPNALGNAWFVRQVTMVDDADEEIQRMEDFDPAQTVIVNRTYAERLNGFTPGSDTSAAILLTTHKPDYLSYQSQSTTDQLAVFSEVYYPKGWNAYINGTEYPYFRADYVLRGMIVPAGEHTIEFMFEPRAYYLGETISLIGSLVLILLLLAVGYLEIRKGMIRVDVPKKGK